MCCLAACFKLRFVQTCLSTCCYSEAVHNFCSLEIFHLKGGRVGVHPFFKGRGCARDVFKLNRNAQIFGDLMDGEDFEVLTIGVPWEPWQFINEAIRIGHPRFLLSRVSPATSVAVDGLLGDPARAQFLKRWSKRAAELKSQEKALHDDLPEHIRTVVAGKRLLLWKEMRTELCYPDAKVIDEIIAGFPMTGWAELSDVFESSVRPLEMTVEQLRGQALGLNHSVVDSLRAAESSDLDQQAWEETQLEVANGWLKPCEVADLRSVHVAERFAIQQGAKLRLIDDLSAAGVNQTVGLGEKLRVESVDELAAGLLSVLSRGPKPLCDDLVGRTLDLKSAYKQFAVDKEHQERLRIAQKHPDGSVRFFAVQALPCGATASGFLLACQ